MQGRLPEWEPGVIRAVSSSLPKLLEMRRPEKAHPVEVDVRSQRGSRSVLTKCVGIDRSSALQALRKRLALSAVPSLKGAH